MDTYLEIIRSIIKSQMAIIGPMAIDEANKIDGLSVDNKVEKVTLISNSPDETIKRLVEQYASLFGAISIEVSKEAVGAVVKNTDKKDIKLPVLLQ